jgi:hypothetical protein
LVLYDFLEGSGVGLDKLKELKEGDGSTNELLTVFASIWVFGVERGTDFVDSSVGVGLESAGVVAEGCTILEGEQLRKCISR